MDPFSMRDKMPIMSFVIRQKDTGEYLQGQKAWTTHPELALRFNSGLNLVQYIERVSPELTPETLEVEVIPELGTFPRAAASA